SGSANDRYQLAMCQSHMGMVYCRGLGRTREGETRINRAMDLCQALARESPSSAAYVVGQADILRNLSRSKTIEGDFTAAVAILTRELSLRERLAREDPGTIAYQDDLGRCLMSLSSQALNIRQIARSRESGDRAVVIFERLIREHPDVPEHKNMLARSRLQQAGAMSLMGDYKQAVVEVEKAVVMAPGDGLTCYNAACGYANSSVVAGRDLKLSKTERQRLAERYASRAVGLLRQAKEDGYFQRR